MIISASRLANERWYGSESRNSAEELRLFDLVSFSTEEHPGLRIVFGVFDEKEHRYFLPLFGIRPGKKTALGEKVKELRSLVYFGGYEYFDALFFPEYAEFLRNIFQKSGEFSGERGRGKFVFSRNAIEGSLKTHYLRDSSNSLLQIEQRAVYKHYRQLFSGEHPEVILGEMKNPEIEQIVPRFYGKAEYLCGGDSYALILNEEFLDSLGTAWELSSDSKNFLQIMNEVGNALARLHCFLIKGIEPTLEPTELMHRFNEIADKYQLNLKTLSNSVYLGKKMRLHGDLHLEQLMLTTEGWRVLDFEGEPTKPFLERKLWGSPLQDLASMCSSIAYRVATADLSGMSAAEGCQTFLAAYCSCDSLKEYLPSEDVFAELLTFFRVERAEYELEYEKIYRPRMQSIPQKILKELLEEQK